MTTVLITGISGDIGLSVLQILRRSFPSWTIWGCDLHHESAGAALVDSFFTSVRPSEPRYINLIEQYIQSGHIDLVIPCSEPEILFLSNPNHSLSVPTITANRKSIEIGSDKQRTADFLKQAGLPAPTTISASERWTGQYPHIVKPRDGRGSRSVFMSNDQAEDSLYRTLFPDSVFQELLSPSDQEITCAVYGTIDNQVAVLALRRRLNGGSTSWCEVIDDPTITDLCVRIARLLELIGSINIQLIRTSRGPMVFEINPRFSSTLEIRDQLGFCDLRWSIEEEFLNRQPDIQRILPDMIAYKVPHTHIVKSDD